MTLKLVHDAADVVSLDVCNFQDIASCARRFADQLDAGDHGDVFRVVLIVESDRGLGTFGWGENGSAYEFVGLYEAAKIQTLQSLAYDDDD